MLNINLDGQHIEVTLPDFGPATDFDAAHIVSEEDLEILAIIKEPEARNERAFDEETFRQSVCDNLDDIIDYAGNVYIQWDPARDQVEDELIVKESNTRIRVDYENGDEVWWEAARNSGTAPEAIKPLLDNVDEPVTVTKDEADEILRWAESLPNWADGPEFARNPLIFD